ncbi:Transcription cofactor vestigial-like 2 [Nipponia nippon]|uniref:Transcription cofactor vestigial-like 2 n=1 Tax=Nipponia nippon TaxID=128390 RepID=A0A091UKL0_NIPNI|nr:Transcription cofactor vestigial-like 2 [Nipponia nippon]
MSCLDVMYQVYGPPQPYFAAAYGPYHQVRAGGSGEEAEGGRGVVWRMAVWGLTKRKKGKGEGEGKGGVCVGGRSGSLRWERRSGLAGCAHRCLSFLSRSLHPDGSFPMSQRSFPPSFWNSTYQPSSVPATLSSPLAAAAHSELPFAAADPYAPASLHGHLHQGGPEPWHHAHHHHHHHHPYIGTQSTSVRPHRLTPASVPTPVSPPCELGKSEAGSAAAWTTPGPFPNAAGDMAQSLGLNVDAARRYSFCGGSLLS